MTFSVPLSDASGVAVLQATVIIGPQLRLALVQFNLLS